MTVGLGILSWKGAETLEPSLESYKNENLFSLFNENVIFLPEQRELETEIAQKYKLDIFGSSENLGIMGGFRALAQSMKSKYILLVENDCPIIESHQEAKQQIELGKTLLETNKAHIIRFRHRENPGQDWSVVRKYRSLFPDNNASLFTKILCFLHRMIRQDKVNRFKGWSIYAPESRGKSIFPDVVEYNKVHDYYLTDSAHLPWTNQSIMINRHFFLKVIISYAESANTKRRINGFRNLEIEMNSDFWRHGRFKIAIPKGIFTHHRVGHRGYKIT